MSKIYIYTELTYKMAKYKEVQQRMYCTAKIALQNSVGKDTFLAGAYLRMILDAAASLCFVNCMSNSLKDKFLTHWLAGKPTNKFKVKVGDEWEYLTTGFLQRNIPIYKKLFTALNPLIHPSTATLDLIVKESADSVFINLDVPTGDVSDMGVVSLYELELDKYDKSMEQIQPTSTEYRELEYSDSVKQCRGEAPDKIRIYREQQMIQGWQCYSVGVWGKILGLKRS